MSYNEELEEYVERIRSQFKLSDFIDFMSLEKVINNGGGKVNFISDDGLFARGKGADGIYPINFTDPKHFELNVDISEGSFELDKDEPNILEKIKTYRTAYTLGILLLLTDYGNGKDFDCQYGWKDVNYSIKDRYSDISCAGLIWFNDDEYPALFARHLLMKKTKMKEFIEDYLKGEESDKRKAIQDFSVLCNVPFKVLLCNIYDYGLK